jgi:hypothetical protein
MPAPQLSWKPWEAANGQACGHAAARAHMNPVASISAGRPLRQEQAGEAMGQHIHNRQPGPPVVRPNVHAGHQTSVLVGSAPCRLERMPAGHCAVTSMLVEQQLASLEPCSGALGRCGVHPAAWHRTLKGTSPTSMDPLHNPNEP